MDGESESNMFTWRWAGGEGAQILGLLVFVHIAEKF